MEMKPEHYILEHEGECWACLGENSYDEYFILGDTFLRGFYSVHDNENARFGFAPHAGSDKAAPYYGTTPKTALNETSTATRVTQVILLITTFVIVVISNLA
jgi:hypothetical protein